MENVHFKLLAEFQDSSKRRISVLMKTIFLWVNLLINSKSKNYWLHCRLSMHGFQLYQFYLINHCAVFPYIDVCSICGKVVIFNVLKYKNEQLWTSGADVRLSVFTWYIAQLVLIIFIHWIVIYVVDSAIHLLNDQGMFSRSKNFISHDYEVQRTSFGYLSICLFVCFDL